MRSISLTPALAQYLRLAAFLDDDLQEIVETLLPLDATFNVKLDDDIAERFRDAFTEHLARVGFRANYELSGEGDVLEDLIDRFAG